MYQEVWSNVSHSNTYTLITAILGIVSIIDVLAFSLKNADYATRRVSDVIGSTNESLTLWCEDSKKPLYFAMEQFIKGVHHSLVQNTEDPHVPLKYLAQIDIMRYLIHNPDAFPSLDELLVQPVDVVTTDFVTPVYLSTPLVEAIALLVQHGAVPVVNDDGTNELHSAISCCVNIYLKIADFCMCRYCCEQLIRLGLQGKEHL